VGIASPLAIISEGLIDKVTEAAEDEAEDEWVLE
jgi:hypothetical protein